ncbi:Anaphase-promoting complex subunit, partial [Lachnellula suecica]
MALTERDIIQLRGTLQEAVVKCSERCLYQSAKWAAELLTSIPPTDDASEPEDSQMTEVPSDGLPSIVVTGNPDPEEAALEAKEINQYLLAKSFFDCREFDRCAAVFLPDTILSGVLSASSSNAPQNAATPKGKGKARAPTARSTGRVAPAVPKLSQKSIFLALYAKYMSGEKKKDEDSEMVMGPHDGGNTINKQLVVISRFLETWFNERTTEAGEVVGSQGWLEYLYGLVLAKDKNEEEAMRWLIRSTHLYPMNWGCWLEMTSLISRTED